MKKIKYVVLLTSLLVFLSSCQPEQEATAVSVEKIAADLILNNGKIVSVDDAFSIHDTIVVSDGRVVELGDASLLDKYSATTVRDLQGKTLIPGFIDSHTHIRGRPRRYIELSEVGSIAEMQDLIQGG